MKNGDFMLELFHYPGSAPLPPERRHPDTDIRAQGTKHLCLRTDDLEGWWPAAGQRCRDRYWPGYHGRIYVLLHSG